MPSFKYDKLRNEFIAGIKNDLEDREWIARFIERYGIQRQSQNNKPSKGIVYNWYAEHTGMPISQIKYDVAYRNRQPPPQPAPQPVVSPPAPVPQPAAPQPPAPQPVVLPPATAPQSVVSQPEKEPESEDSDALGLDDISGIDAHEANVSGETAKTLMGQSKEKIKIELGRLGSILSDFENWIYTKWKMRPLNEEERIETNEAVKTVVDNRIKIISEYGDIANFGLVILSHAGSRIADAHLQKDSQPKPDNRPEGQDPFQPMRIGPNGTVVM